MFNKGIKCFTNGCCCNSDLGMLFLRIAVGVPFIIHGLAKLGDIAGTTAFFASLGLPAFFVYLITILEVVAGSMILLGLWSAIGGWIVSIIMLGAYIIVKNKMPFFGGYELDMVFFFAGLAVAMLGSGKYSVKKDSCCNTCPVVSHTNGQMNPNNCSHSNCKCGDCSKCS